MNDFDLWVNSCSSDSDCRLYCLEGRGETGLYQTKTRYMPKGEWNYFYHSPVYHVWIEGKCVFTSPDYGTAYRKYRASHWSNFL